MTSGCPAAVMNRSLISHRSMCTAVMTTPPNAVRVLGYRRLSHSLAPLHDCPVSLIAHIRLRQSEFVPALIPNFVKARSIYVVTQYRLHDRLVRHRNPRQIDMPRYRIAEKIVASPKPLKYFVSNMAVGDSSRSIASCGEIWLSSWVSKMCMLTGSAHLHGCYLDRCLRVSLQARLTRRTQNAAG